MKLLRPSHGCRNFCSHPRVFSLDQVASTRNRRSLNTDQVKHPWHHLVSACNPSRILPFSWVQASWAQASGAPALPKKTTPSQSQARTISLSGMTLHRDKRISKTNSPNFHPVFQVPCQTIGTIGPATTIFRTISSSKALSTLHRTITDSLPLAATIYRRTLLRFPRPMILKRVKDLLPHALVPWRIILLLVDKQAEKTITSDIFLFFYIPSVYMMKHILYNYI